MEGGHPQDLVAMLPDAMTGAHSSIIVPFGRRGTMSYSYRETSAGAMRVASRAR